MADLTAPGISLQINTIGKQGAAGAGDFDPNADEKRKSKDDSSYTGQPPCTPCTFCTLIA